MEIRPSGNKTGTLLLDAAGHKTGIGTEQAYCTPMWGRAQHLNNTIVLRKVETNADHQHRARLAPPGMGVGRTRGGEPGTSRYQSAWGVGSPGRWRRRTSRSCWRSLVGFPAWWGRYISAWRASTSLYQLRSWRQRREVRAVGCWAASLASAGDIGGNRGTRRQQRRRRCAGQTRSGEDVEIDPAQAGAAGVRPAEKLLVKPVTLGDLRASGPATSR